MNVDVALTLEQHAAAKAAAAAERAELAANWRRLLLYRKGLAEELIRLSAGRLEEDPDKLFKAKIAAAQAGSPNFEQEVEDARRRQTEHAAASRLTRLSPGWHRQAAKLQSSLEASQTRLAEHEQSRTFREGMLRRAAEAEGRKNARLNSRAMAPHADHRSRLASVDLALGMLRQGDDSLSACLRRWDLEALLKLANIRRKLDTYGTVSATEWALYCSAGVAPAMGPNAMPDFVAMPDMARQPVADEGSVVRVQMTLDGLVSGVLRRTYGGHAEGTDLAALDTVRLAELLGRLHMDGLATDADLLEAYLDSTLPDWRERVAEAVNGQGTASGSGQAAAGGVPRESPWDVLGVTETMEMADIAQAFMDQMQAVSKLPNSAPQRRLTDAFKAIRATHNQKAQSCP